MKNLLKILRKCNVTIEKNEKVEEVEEDILKLKNEEIYEKKLLELKESYIELTKHIKEDDLRFFDIGYQALTSMDKKEKEYFYYKLLVENENKEKNILKTIQNYIKESYFSLRNSDFLSNFNSGQNSKQQEVIKPVEEKEVVQEKTIFKVELTSFDAAKKLMVIKTLKSILNLGLKETKEFVEKTPQIIKNDINKEEAEELREKLTKIGCVISIK